MTGVGGRQAFARMRDMVTRNRPSQKPQLWEDFTLAARRRVEFEVRRWFDPTWLDQPTTIRLSTVGFDADCEHQPPLYVTVRPREMVSRSMFLYGMFEISETRLVQAFLRPGMTFVDVGANIGYYTLIGSRLVGASGQVYAFEPNEGVRTALDANIALNGLTNVLVQPHAVCDQDGHISFYESSWDANQGISSLFPGVAREKETRVASVKFDTFAATLSGRSIDLVKMDIEGAERLAIEGGRRVFSEVSAPALIFEAAELDLLEPLVRSLGYQIRRIDYTLHGGLRLLPPEAPERSVFADYEAPNYFAVKHAKVFDQVIERANSRRRDFWQLLGRL